MSTTNKRCGSKKEKRLVSSFSRTSFRYMNVEATKAWSCLLPTQSSAAVCVKGLRDDFYEFQRSIRCNKTRVNRSDRSDIVCASLRRQETHVERLSNIWRLINFQSLFRVVGFEITQRLMFKVVKFIYWKKISRRLNLGLNKVIRWKASTTDLLWQ